MEHNIILFVYRLTGAFSQGVVLRTSSFVTGPGLPVPMTRPSIFTTGIDFRARAGQKTFVRVEQIVARQIRFGHRQASFLRPVPSPSAA